jgi:hypothetical protein
MEDVRTGTPARSSRSWSISSTGNGARHRWRIASLRPSPGYPSSSGPCRDTSGCRRRRPPRARCCACLRRRRPFGAPGDRRPDARDAPHLTESRGSESLSGAASTPVRSRCAARTSAGSRCTWPPECSGSRRRTRLWSRRPFRRWVLGSGIEFTDRGEHDLKGVPGVWRLYAVRAAQPS